MFKIRLIPRFFWIAFSFLTTLPRYLYRRVAAGSIDRAGVERLRGKVLASTLERLGATFVKFGQILGSRPDLLGPGYIESLAKLQDDVPAMPYSVVEQVISMELSATERARIVEIDPRPIAAASVAQVHSGKLSTGERVALKVQRPEAEGQIERDLAILSLGAAFLDLLPPMKMFSLPGSVERFGKALSAQLDFRLEASNNRRLAANFADVRGVKVPDLFDEFCTQRLLTMEFIEGHKATHPEKVKGRKARRRLAARGGEAILQMIFQDGFVHADLHPGNILMMEDGTMVFVDLGMVAEIPRDLLRPWVETFAALAEQDGRAAAELFYIYAPTVGTLDYPRFEEETIAFFKKLEGFVLGQVEVSAILGEMMGILRRHKIQIDPVFTVVNIGILVAEGLGKQLDPEVDLIQMAVPYLKRALDEAPEGRAPNRSVPVR